MDASVASQLPPHICRLCGVENEDSLGIFDVEDGSVTPATLIKKCIPIKLRKTDALPKKVCRKCWEEVERIWQFISLVVSTQAKFKPAISKKVISIGTGENGEKTDFTIIDLPIEPLVQVKLENVETDAEEPSRPTRAAKVDHFVNEDDEEDDEEDGGGTSDGGETSDPYEGEKEPKEENSMGESTDESDGESDDSDYGPRKWRKRSSPGRTTRRGRGRPRINPPKVKEDGEFKIPRKPREKKAKEACTRCGQMINPAYMARHLLRHDLKPGEKLPPRSKLEPGQKPVYMCHECGKQFAQKGNLDAHMRTHTGEKPFKCDLCPKAFSQKGNLDEHRRMHTNERPFVCEICGVRFARQAQIKIHMRTHTGQRPYQCQFCPQSFKRLQTLRKHQRMHLDLRPYPCDMCEKRFRDRDKLIVHRRIHTGERPYKCSVCGRGFYESGNLYKHAKVHQKDGAIGAVDKSLVIVDDTIEKSEAEFRIKPKYDCHLCATEFAEEKLLIEHMGVHEKELNTHVRSDGRRGAKKAPPRKSNENQPQEPENHVIPATNPGNHHLAMPASMGVDHETSSIKDFIYEHLEQSSCATNSTVDEDKPDICSPDRVATPGSSASMPVFPTVAPSLYPLWPFTGHGQV